MISSDFHGLEKNGHDLTRPAAKCRGRTAADPNHGPRQKKDGWLAACFQRIRLISP
jgi:hypothetical protein